MTTHSHEIKMELRLDTEALLVGFWADLAVQALAHLGGQAKAAPALHDRINELTDPDERKRLDDGVDALRSLSDGRFARVAVDG